MFDRNRRAYDPLAVYTPQPRSKNKSYRGNRPDMNNSGNEKAGVAFGLSSENRSRGSTPNKFIFSPKKRTNMLSRDSKSFSRHQGKREPSSLFQHSNKVGATATVSNENSRSDQQEQSSRRSADDCRTVRSLSNKHSASEDQIRVSVNPSSIDRIRSQKNKVKITPGASFAKKSTILVTSSGTPVEDKVGNNNQKRSFFSAFFNNHDTKRPVDHQVKSSENQAPGEQNSSSKASHHASSKAPVQKALETSAYTEAEKPPETNKRSRKNNDTCSLINISKIPRAVEDKGKADSTRNAGKHTNKEASMGFARRSSRLAPQKRSHVIIDLLDDMDDNVDDDDDSDDDINDEEKETGDDNYRDNNKAENKTKANNSTKKDNFVPPPYEEFVKVAVIPKHLQKNGKSKNPWKGAYVINYGKWEIKYSKNWPTPPLVKIDEKSGALKILSRGYGFNTIPNIRTSEFEDSIKLMNLARIK